MAMGIVFQMVLVQKALKAMMMTRAARAGLKVQINRVLLVHIK
jgi:hypothetical protein